MKKFILSYAILFVILPSFVHICTAQTDLKKLIKFIKNEYKAIMSSSTKMKNLILYKNDDSDEFNTTINNSSYEFVDNLSIYRDHGVVRYVIYQYYGALSAETISYYFYKNQLIFMFHEVNFEDEGGDINPSYVNRYYIDNGKLIQFLEGKAKKNIKPDTEEFINAQVFVNLNYNLIKPYIK